MVSSDKFHIRTEPTSSWCWIVGPNGVDVAGPFSTEAYASAWIERDELRAENEGLKETIAEWQEIHGTFTGDVHAACQVEIERLRTALLEARDSVAGEITLQRGGNGPWIPANPNDPLLAIVEKIDTVLA